MPVTVVESDKAFFGEYTKALVERSKIPISTYVEDARTDREIENALQELFTAEVVNWPRHLARPGNQPRFLGRE